MSIFIYYLVIAFTCGLSLTTLFLFKNKDNKKLSLIFKILSVTLGIVFLFRYMLGSDAIQNMLKLANTPFTNKFVNFFALILVWFTYAGNLILSLYGFFDIKRINNFVKFISLPFSILNVCFLNISFTAIMGLNAIREYTFRGFVFAIEIGLALAYSIFILITKTEWKTLFKKKNKEKIEEDVIIKPIHKEEQKPKRIIRFWNSIKNICLKIGAFFKKYWFDIFVVLILVASVMPSYALQGIFGNIHQIYKPKDLEIPHRIILYIGFLLPIIIHFSLKNKEYKEKKFYLLYICLGTLLTFSMSKRFSSFLDPTSWPLHLCNTAMYIMPIVLMFNMKRFFYFTYFINVLGAFFAMVMPNYSDASNIFSSSLINFYVNHYIAFFMPLLFVSLKMFDKPRFKQFVYSFIGFGCYFVLVLFLNALFTGLFNAGLVSQSTDFFFINSDFIASKLGSWAERLRDITASFTIKGVTLTFYPLYQVLFFITYVALGFGMWFIYEQGYAIANSLEDMRQRKEKIKLDELALKNYLNGRSIKEPMQPENSNKLILTNFSKRYGNSDVYAVKDANLEVNGGEIFGFLGPNGAGKSTIIKTIVGIQPITSGRISVCGYDLDTQGIEAKRQIGYVPDHYALYEKLTGREYINYIADLYDVSLEDRNERINNYVKRFELEGAFDNQMKTYSHGMKQKIAIMSALVHNPKIWILDEPLTGLDPNSIFQVKECMKEHAKAGNIVFFSSHIIDVVERICDKIAIIKKGNILLTKTVEDIEKDGDTLENFYMNTINGADYVKRYSVEEVKQEEKVKKSKTKNERVKKEKVVKEKTLPNKEKGEKTND